MRIALIHLGRKGGGPPYILDLAKALHARGEEVCVFLSSQVENRNIFEQQDFKTCFFDTYNHRKQIFQAAFYILCKDFFATGCCRTALRKAAQRKSGFSSGKNFLY